MKELNMTAAVETERVLTALDRCDKCGAAAKVVSTFMSGELMFCGHHARETKWSLQQKSLHIYDPENELSL